MSKIDKTRDQLDFEKHFWELVPQELMDASWNNITKRGFYSNPWVAAAYSCWKKSITQPTVNIAAIRDDLNDMPLTEALWWFIENINEDSLYRTPIFFYLRERVKNGI